MKNSEVKIMSKKQWNIWGVIGLLCAIGASPLVLVVSEPMDIVSIAGWGLLVIAAGIAGFLEGTKRQERKEKEQRGEDEQN